MSWSRFIDAENPPMRLQLAIASWYQPRWVECARSWQHSFLLIPKMGILAAYNRALELTSADVIGYVHDDVIVHDLSWKQRVLEEFAAFPDCAIVGFGGGYGYGAERMYDFPYQTHSLGRVGFRSNMTNAEVHGARFTGSCNGACLDGFAFFVLTDFLREIGGWPTETVSYFTYMEWLCLTAIRMKRRIRIVGVACEHIGGASTGMNPDLNPDFHGEHKFIFDNFRDVLPVRVTP